MTTYEKEVFDLLNQELTSICKPAIDEDDIESLEDIDNILVEEFELTIDWSISTNEERYYILDSGIIKGIYDVTVDWEGLINNEKITQLRVVSESEWNEIVSEKIQELEDEIVNLKSKLK